MGSETSLNATQKTAPSPAKPMAVTQPCAILPKDQSALLRQQEASAVVPLVPGMVLDTIWVLYDAESPRRAGEAGMMAHDLFLLPRYLTSTI
jgi:hypothetical protein